MARTSPRYAAHQGNVFFFHVELPLVILNETKINSLNLYARRMKYFFFFCNLNAIGGETKLYGHRITHSYAHIR